LKSEARKSCDLLLFKVMAEADRFAAMNKK
jgi:hypothetical protein